MCKKRVNFLGYKDLQLLITFHEMWRTLNEGSYTGSCVRLQSNTQITQKDYFCMSLPPGSPPRNVSLVKAVNNCFSCLNAPRRHQTVLVVQNQYLSASSSGKTVIMIVFTVDQVTLFHPKATKNTSKHTQHPFGKSFPSATGIKKFHFYLTMGVRWLRKKLR